MVYSIIIPHKNVPELLKILLKSIPERNDTEIIIVDDNSDSEKVDFTRFPGNDRKDVKVIFLKESRGAGYARNIGMERATGKWLLFADADDYFGEALSSILDKYKDDDTTDMVFFNYCKITDTGLTIKMPISRYIYNYNKNRLFSEDVLRYSAWSPWSRMVRRNLPVMNNVKFEELPFGNDMMFVLKTTSLAIKIAVEDDIIYYYYAPTSGSITNNYSINPKYKTLHLENQLKLRKFYNEVNYHFIAPIWKVQKGVDSIVVNKLFEKYGFKNINNLVDSFYYFLAKFLHFI